MRRECWHHGHQAYERTNACGKAPSDHAEKARLATSAHHAEEYYANRPMFRNGREALRVGGSEVISLWPYGVVNAIPWDTLIGAWGFCEQHAWVAWVYLNVDIAIHRGQLLGRTILYGARLQEAVRAFRPKHLVTEPWMLLQFLAIKDCLLCDIKPKCLAAQASWRWAERDGDERCRRHLIADIDLGKPVGLEAQEAALQDIATRVSHYERLTPRRGLQHCKKRGPRSTHRCDRMVQRLASATCASQTIDPYRR